MLLTASAVTSATAAPITFTCPPPDASACNGSTYALALTSFGETSPGVYSYELLFGVDTTGYTGASTDFLESIAFKSIVDEFSNLALIDAPEGAGNWDVFFRELNGNGCGGGNTESTCVQAGAALNGGYGMPVAPAVQYFWTFQFDSSDATPNATGHIKYRYLNEEGEKVGSLGSFDISLQQGDDDDTVVAPEPGTLLLLCAAGATIAQRRRRR